MWFESRWTLLGLGTIAFGFVALTAPKQASAQGAVFKSSVEMVALTVTVTDASGRCVTGLTADHFAIFEDGVAQTLSLFGSDDIPVDVGLVLDTSSSMLSALPIIQSAARRLVSRLRPGDRAAVIDVKKSVRIPQPFTEDHAKVASAVGGLSATGTTAIYDGLYTLLQEFERERRMRPQIRRQALVLLSDGLDTASHVSFDDVTELTRSRDVTIYAIALQQPALAGDRAEQDRVRRASWEMRALARETGGLAFFPSKAAELEGVYDAIARELVNQYALGYVTSAPRPDGAFRRVGVKILAPAEGNPRTRTGYVAKPPTSTRAAALIP